MGVLFEDDFLDGLGTWPLAYIFYGGPDFGELLAVAQTVGRGDTDAYCAAWFGERDRISSALCRRGGTKVALWIKGEVATRKRAVRALGCVEHRC
jgi:hypothetical protein